MALELFTKKTFSPTSIIAKTASYTALVTDQEIDMSGSGLTLTLPALDSFQNTLQQGEKLYLVKNTSTTYTLTIQPGTNSVTGVANTIDSRAVYTLYPGDSVLIKGYSNLLDWIISDPTTRPILNRAPFQVAVATNGTAVVNVFDANGSPSNLFLDAVLLINGSDTASGNITVTNGTDTTLTLAKSTSANAVVGAGGSSLSFRDVAKGAVFTVVSSTAGNTEVVILGTTQTLLARG